MILQRRTMLLAIAGMSVACGDARSVQRDWTAGAQQTIPITDSAFGSLIVDLSGPAGFFDTDNLISNESSYLHVLGKLDDLPLAGGAYLGVGPDQNFSYIAAVRPSIAFIIDIRRDNMLEHFLFKALFHHARNRMEYLRLLVGAGPVADTTGAGAMTIEEIVRAVDRAPRTADAVARSKQLVEEAVRALRFTLSASDLATIGRFHDAFIGEGLDLRFTSYNRPARPYYPSYRSLLLETDLDGQHRNYIVDPESFRFVQDLEHRNLIIPLVGDLAGTRAVRAVGAWLHERGIPVSAFYVSNVEFYLMRSGTFASFADNVRALPRHDQSVVIRSFFGRGFGWGHPMAVQGYYSTQLLQYMSDLVTMHETNNPVSYIDLVTQHAIPLR